jgi:DNA-binding YbaB/EbfC family protein
MAKGGFPGDLGQIMKQAQQMMKGQEKLQDELRERVVEADAGGGMVTAYVNGIQEVVKLSIEPEVIDPEDREMLEDLVLAAVNAGMAKAKELRDKEMAKLTGGMPNIPGLFG